MTPLGLARLPAPPRWILVAVLALLAVALASSPASSAAAVPGQRRHRHVAPGHRLAGHGQRAGRLRRPSGHRQPDPEPGEPGHLDHLDGRPADHSRGPAGSRRTTCRSCSAGATTTAPIPSNPGPPPEQCVYGATDGRVRRAAARDLSRRPGHDPGRIISRGLGRTSTRTTASSRRRTGYVWRPFRAVDGTVVDAHTDPDFNPAIVGGNYWLNPYFNIITTNEIAGARTGPNGTGAELFEVDTGLESTGLGCGQRLVAGRRRRGADPEVLARGRAARRPGGGERGDAVRRPGLAVRRHHVAARARGLGEPDRDPARVQPGRQPLLAGGTTSADRRHRARVAGDLELAARAVRHPGPDRRTAYATVSDAAARQQLVSRRPVRPGMAITLPTDRPCDRRPPTTRWSTRRSPCPAR